MPKIIELSGTVGWDITAKDLKKKLPNTGEEVLLKIDSPGGSVFEGNRLYNALNDHLNTFPGSVKVELGAIAASAASYFPLAVGAKNIKVRSNTTFMGHKAWTFAIGNADDMKAEAEILDGFDKIIAKVYSKITGKTSDESLEDMKNEFWLIGGQSVVDAGFASEIIDDDETEESEESEIVDKVEILA
ncbi:MAG: Clp protease ClpP, partial [Alphaproteobacteria bacterium]|nr:Clp protease ClpP [Alphaproteobacteria bacterium]